MNVSVSIDAMFHYAFKSITQQRLDLHSWKAVVPREEQLKATVKMWPTFSCFTDFVTLCSACAFRPKSKTIMSKKLTLESRGEQPAPSKVPLVGKFVFFIYVSMTLLILWIHVVCLAFRPTSQKRNACEHDTYIYFYCNWIYERAVEARHQYVALSIFPCCHNFFTFVLRVVGLSQFLKNQKS